MRHDYISINFTDKIMHRYFLAILLSCCCAIEASAQTPEALQAKVNALAAANEERVIEWRRDIHANPELGNREFRTAALVADHLRSLEMEVRTEIAHTGVVGILRGGSPGPVVALRADMDALPVTELADVPFASKVRTEYNGSMVGVMHACGHDNHVAIAMGAAHVLASMREDLPGTVMFIFQPAEEGAPAGEEGGAELMLKEGVFDDPTPEAIFGLHVWPARVGEVGYRSGPFMASANGLEIKVTGRQTHGAIPWGGVDPIVVASQIVLGLQTVVSRQLDATASPSIITIGSINGGVRGNIIPDEVMMTGTVRTFLPEVFTEIEERIHHTAMHIAEAAGAKAEVKILHGVPVTANDPDLTERMLPTLRRVAGPDNVVEMRRRTGAEDFSYFANAVPGLYVFLGVTPEDRDPETAPPNHSPYFYADEKALLLGVRLMSTLALEYLAGN